MTGFPRAATFPEFEQEAHHGSNFNQSGVGKLSEFAVTESNFLNAQRGLVVIANPKSNALDGTTTNRYYYEAIFSLVTLCM